MPRSRIVIVGDLPNRPDRSALIKALIQRQSAIEWEWIQPVNDSFGLPHDQFMRLQNQLRTQQDKVRRGQPADVDIRVIKLGLINGKDANTLFVFHPDPVLAPVDLETPSGLIDWIFSADAGLIPPGEWQLPVREVGLLCLLAKLLRNKSFNKDVQGHAWTKESHLLGQSPVNRPNCQRVYGEAVDCLERADGTLLITKGGSQGKTPKEWCINTAYLPAVKRAAVARSLDPFREERSLTALMDYIDRGPPDLEQVDDQIVSEKILFICRDR